MEVDCKCTETLPSHSTCSTMASKIIVQVRRTKTLCFCIPIGNHRQKIIPLLTALLRDVKEICDMIRNFSWSQQSLKYIYGKLENISQVTNGVHAILECLRSKISIVVSDSDHDTEILSDEDIFS